MPDSAMGSFDENGFLYGRIQQWMEIQNSFHKDLFERAAALNRDCHLFLDGRAVEDGNGKQIATSVLFARLLELYQSIIVACERGMAATTRILSRAFLEASYHFFALQRDPTYLTDYMDQFLIEKKKLMSRIRQSPSTNEEMRNLRQSATDLLVNENEKLIHDRSARKVSTEEIARRAGMHDSYLTAYAILSHAVHTGISDIERHLQINDVTKEIEAYKYGPSDEETVKEIGLSGMTLAEALELASQTFGEDRKSLCVAHREAFRSLLEKK
jgi:hypothetical protein